MPRSLHINASIRICVLLIVLFFFTGAYGRTLDEIKRSGKIYVAFSPGDLESIDYDLALEFARYLNVELIEVHIEWDEAFMRNGILPPDLESNPELRYTPDALKKCDIIFVAIHSKKPLVTYEIAEDALQRRNNSKRPPVKKGLFCRCISLVGVKLMTGTLLARKTEHIIDCYRLLSTDILLFHHQNLAQIVLRLFRTKQTVLDTQMLLSEEPSAIMYV